MRHNNVIYLEEYRKARRLPVVPFGQVVDGHLAAASTYDETPDPVECLVKNLKLDGRGKRHGKEVRRPKGKH